MAVTANTTIQLSVPDHLRGRVMSVYTTVFSGSVPAGGLVMGAIASRWGVPPALFLGGVIALAAAVLTIPSYRRAVGTRTAAPATARVAALPPAAAPADLAALDADGRTASGAVRARARSR